MPNMSNETHLMLEACLKASQFISKDFYTIKELGIHKKGLKDFATKTDLKAEEVIVTHLKEGRPSYSFLSEESGEIKIANTSTIDFRWIIDPIDGTFNFIHNNPNFAISIALENKSCISSCMIYLPISGEFFWAERDKGAYHVNEKGKQTQLFMSASDDFEYYSVTINFLEKIDTNQKKFFLKNIIERNCQIRISGSAVIDLAYLASGRHNLLIHANLHPWDIASGLLLIEEAGGYSANFLGNKMSLNDKNIIAGKKTIVEDFINRSR